MSDVQIAEENTVTLEFPFFATTTRNKEVVTNTHYRKVRNCLKKYGTKETITRRFDDFGLSVVDIHVTEITIKVTIEKHCTERYLEKEYTDIISIIIEDVRDILRKVDGDEKYLDLTASFGPVTVTQSNVTMLLRLPDEMLYDTPFIEVMDSPQETETIQRLDELFDLVFKHITAGYTVSIRDLQLSTGSNALATYNLSIS